MQSGPPKEIATTPLWQDGAGAAFVRPEETAAGDGRLPPRVEILVVGGGYTGLSAARETAAAGLATLVLDAAAPGTGCSGRNGGQVAYSIKPSLEQLAAKHGHERAYAICRDGLDAIAYLRELAAEEGFDCDWRATGSFYGAHTAAHFAEMAHAARHQPPGLEQRIRVVPRGEQHAEIGSDYYHGGCVYHDDASVDPVRLLDSLRRRARAAGAETVYGCEVTSLERSGDGYLAHTARGPVRARRVLLATNGYSRGLSPWHRRRVIPIGSYQIATEPLGAQRMRALIPHGRHVSDSRRVVVYFRPSADGERLIFGGRAALGEPDPLVCVPRLRAMMAQIFPQLRTVRVTHAWAGWVAYTFDTLPHVGERDGLHYCMGYCGQGVVLAPYLGMRVGRRMAGLPGGASAFDGLEFPSRPYHFGTPWFLAPAVFAYRWLDRLGL